jgi:signal transduction histidine kinase
LGLARLGHSTEPKQLVDLSALADAVVEEYRGLGKDVTFVEAPRTTLVLQVNLVRRLLRNLIDNAVKYGERAVVSLQSGAGAVALVVEDQGPGIPEAQLGDVLQPFARLDNSRSRLTGGTGLGLSIADAIAKSQGASLVLANRKTGGLCATVRWPAAA